MEFGCAALFRRRKSGQRRARSGELVQIAAALAQVLEVLAQLSEREIERHQAREVVHGERAQARRLAQIRKVRFERRGRRFHGERIGDLAAAQLGRRAI